MRKIHRTKQFKKDYKRESKGRYKAELDELLVPVLSDLVSDIPLDESYLDHALSNNWKGYRDCHLKPDLLLIYQNSEEEILNLKRLGSHSELGL